MAREQTVLSDIPRLAYVLPPGKIMMSLLDHLRDDEVTAEQLVRVARNDPVIVGNLISAANQIRRNRDLPDVADPLSAVVLIGVTKAKEIIVTVGTNKLELHGEIPFFYRHSQAVAIVAREVATMCDVDPEHAYSAGMLHDIGQLCFHVSNPRAFAVVSKAGAMDGKTTAHEERVFGLDHSEFGALMAEHWSLPEVVVSAIRTHHSDSIVTSKLQATINVAESLTRALDLPPSQSNRVTCVNEAAVEELRIRWHSPAWFKPG